MFMNAKHLQWWSWFIKFEVTTKLNYNLIMYIKHNIKMYIEHLNCNKNKVEHEIIKEYYLKKYFKTMLYDL